MLIVLINRPHRR